MNSLVTLNTINSTRETFDGLKIFIFGIFYSYFFIQLLENHTIPLLSNENFDKNDPIIYLNMALIMTSLIINLDYKFPKFKTKKGYTAFIIVYTGLLLLSSIVSSWYFEKDPQFNSWKRKMLLNIAIVEKYAFYALIVLQIIFIFPSIYLLIVN